MKNVIYHLYYLLFIILIMTSCSFGGDLEAWRARAREANIKNITYTVTFNKNNGDTEANPNSITVTSPANTVGALPADPTRIGYNFVGWNTAANGSGTDFTAATAVTADIIVYAQWQLLDNKFSVTFVTGGGSPAPVAQEVESGAKIIEPGAMTNGAFTFGGWYREDTFTSKWDFAANTVTANITLYAKWGYAVVFSANGGSPAPDQQIISLGGKVSKPDEMTRPGYTFDAWYKDSAFITEWNFDVDIVMSNTPLYARWEYASYSITYQDLGGKTFSGIHGIDFPETHTYNTATTLINPTKANNTFNGWYINSSGTGTALTIITATDYTEDIILYAKWTPDTYSITYQDLGGETFSGTHGSGYPKTHTYGTVTTLINPAKANYVFNGWFINSDCIGNALTTLSATDYTEDITLYAKWYFDIDMVWISAGTFIMGSPENEPGHSSNETQHEVTLTKGFHMGKYPIIQAQYQAIMGNNPSSFTTSSGGDNPANRPVDRVSWYDAIVFCNRLSIVAGLSPAYYISGSTNPDDWGTIPTDSDATWNAVIVVAGSTGYRLPTEAQWEYACRAGTTSAYNWGTNYIDDSKANYIADYVDANNTTAGTYLGRTTEAGKYAPNAWGLYDMHGNVMEWCWDWYGTYSSVAQEDPIGASSGPRRVKRGGSGTGYGQYLRSAARATSDPYYRSDYNGFRVLRP